MDAKKEKKPLSKGMRILILAGVIVGGLAVGAGTGYLIGHFGKTPEVVEEIKDLDAIEDNDANLLDRYEQVKKEGRNPVSVFSISELANISMSKFTSHEYSVAIGYGVANSAVNLDVRNYAIKNGDEYYEESLSKSKGAINIVVCQRDYQHGNEKTSPIDSYTGDIKTDAEHPDWSKPTKTDYTAESYEEKFGKMVSRPSVYVVSSQSVLDEGSSVEKTADGYQLTMNLDTIKGIARYRKRMMNLSGSNVKKFEYVHLTYYVDDDFNLIRSYVEEKYAAGIAGISANVEGSLSTYFFTDTNDVKIPEIGVNVTFPKEGQLYA
ncbi:MAG: hypothetical protein K6E11_04165 [Bacilli bacterium]|nr:hypothetical protein [Bacilli bacterium]